MKKECPVTECKSPNYSKDGTFYRKDGSQLVQRFRCKKCGKRFSNASFSLQKNQKKRTSNRLVFELLASGMSMRRIAKVARLNKNTIQRKVDYLDLEAEKHNQKLLKQIKHSVHEVQFDDMITTEKTKLKPVSISTATCVGTRFILGAKASQIPAFGHLASVSRQKYGFRKSLHKEGLDDLFQILLPCVHPNAHFISDEHKLYPEFVQRYFPGATHARHKGGRACVVGQGELKRHRRDPLFAINHTCAMFRDNLKRLARKTWCVTQKIENLQKHLNIYIWYHNSVLLGEKTPLLWGG